MKLIAINADITTLEVDCIVNASNPALMHGGGVCGAIFEASGANELAGFIAQNYGLGCLTGQVVVTPGFNLPAKFILHTVGPDMRLYAQEAGDTLLQLCYINCIEAAFDEGLTSIAFPAISTGIFGFDKKRAATIAVTTLMDYSGSEDIEITFACFGDEDTAIVQAAIDDEDASRHYLSWSMYNEQYDIDSAAGKCDIEGDWEVLYADLSTDVPTGIYMVSTTYDGNLGVAKGVVINDGVFDIDQTLRACAVARNNAGYWGTFLEGLDWNSETEEFTAHFGS